MDISGNWLNFWSGFSTIGTLVLFVGVVIWAMSGKRKKDFDAAANLPLENERKELTEPDSAANK